MLRSAFVAFASLCLVALFTLPSLSTAQPPPPQRTPDDYFHGWVATDIATLPASATNLPNYYYIIDSSEAILALDVSDPQNPKTVYSITYRDGSHLQNIAVDGRGYVYVTSVSDYTGDVQLKVHDNTLKSVKNISMSSAAAVKPNTKADNLQVAIDVYNYVYVFDGHGYTHFRDQSGTKGQVWEFEPRGWTQSAQWMSPVRFNSTISYIDYLFAIDNTNIFYFQEDWLDKMLVLTDDAGTVQQTLQLGSSDYTEPFITDLVVDSQLQMWHTLYGSTYVSVISSDNGQLIAAYNVLSDSDQGLFPSLAVDAGRKLVVVGDPIEQGLKQLSNGNTVDTVYSPVAPMDFVSELLGDYSGRGAASLLIDDGRSDYPVRRISIGGPGQQPGALLQRYQIPSRLTSQCYGAGVDLGFFSGNIYLLLSCNQFTSQEYALVYVMAQSGLVVSEFRVDAGSFRVRADEQAGLIYVATSYYYPSYHSAVLAYSSIDGTLQKNYTTSSPAMGYITDITVIPSPPGSPSIVVAIDYTNDRYVNFDTTTMPTPPPVVFPFANGTFTYDLAYSVNRQGLVLYASGYAVTRVNNTFNYYTFVARIDVTDPKNPKTTDIFVGAPGVEADFGPIAVGVDGHLYAYDFVSYSLYRWRDADRRVEAEQSGEPRVHVVDSVGGVEVAEKAPEAKVSVPVGVAAAPQSSNRHSRVRGLRSQ